MSRPPPKKSLARSAPVAGLGFDAGGTQTRWALADAGGRIIAEGAARGFSALQMESERGRVALHAALAELASQVLQHQKPTRVHAGLTGFGGDAAALSRSIATALGLAPACVSVGNDIEIAYLDTFAPGEGYLIYAGTGSIASLMTADGVMHRAGGRGHLLDDAGGGVWIAREALRHIWRAEDEQPGCWLDSPLASAVFAHIGGNDWGVTRTFMYTRERGEIGKLALAVAQAAETDAIAFNILHNAGVELARLGLALTRRFGVRPFALSGRVLQLHPVVEHSLRAALPTGAAITVRHSQAHHAAAGIAVRAALAPAAAAATEIGT